ncbi:MAG: protein kinase [Candidatus Korobacteraceae bacterium]
MYASGQRIRLQEQPLQVLRLLIDHAGKVVSREEIQAKLWPNDTVVEFDNAINTAVRKLRMAFADSNENPRYIETVARRGYRFIMAVEELDSSAGGLSLDAAPPASPDAGIPFADQSAGLTGKTVSHYRVLEVIGGGGMGVVYRAEDLRLDRAVALKFLPEEMGSDQRALERFEREARAASSLDHLNICSIYEFGEHQGQPFIVMPLLRGQTLRDWLASADAAEDAVPLAHLLDLAIQIAGGLGAAHEKGIIHRDIKPANIFVTTSGTAKILDFGLAKVLEATGNSLAAAAGAQAAPGLDAPPSSIGLSLSRTGITVGTAGYMSPEQVRGEELDARTDLFSFGLVLYEMATGHRTFSGETAAVARDAILYQTPVPARELNPGIPPKLEAIIDKALAKDRELRYASAVEMRADLLAVKPSKLSVDTGVDTSRSDRESSATAFPTERLGDPRRMRGIPAPRIYRLVVMPALFGIALIGWFLHSKLSHRNQPGRKPLSIDRLTTDGSIAGSGTISPDGKYIVYATSESGQLSLRVRQVDTASTLEIVPPINGRFDGTTFSPDGNYVYYVQTGEKDSDLYQVPTLGGPRKKVLSGVLGPVSFSPDGQRIAYKRVGSDGAMQLVIANSDGSEPRVLFSRDFGVGLVPRMGTSWSPDGKFIATPEYLLLPESHVTILVFDLSGNMRDLLPDFPGLVFRLLWLPDGSGLVFTGNSYYGGPHQIMLASYPSGEVKPVTSGPDEYDLTSLGICGSMDSIFAVQTTTITNLWLASGSLRTPKQLTTTRLNAPFGMDFSGHQIVYPSHIVGGITVWGMDARSSLAAQISPRGLRAVNPALSPDGRQFAFEGTEGNKTNIWTGQVDGTNVRQITFGNKDYRPSFAPDGNSVLFSREENSKPYVYVVSTAGGSVGRFLDVSLDIDRAPCGSTSILTFIFEQNRWRHAVVSTSDGRPQTVFDLPSKNGWEARCTPDGKAITYVDYSYGPSGEISNLWSIPVRGGPPSQLTHFTSEAIWDYAWSRDGGELLLSRGTVYSDAVLIRNFR